MTDKIKLIGETLSTCGDCGYFKEELVESCTSGIPTGVTGRCVHPDISGMGSVRQEDIECVIDTHRYLNVGSSVDSYEKPPAVACEITDNTSYKISNSVSNILQYMFGCLVCNKFRSFIQDYEVYNPLNEIKDEILCMIDYAIYQNLIKHTNALDLRLTIKMSQYVRKAVNTVKKELLEELETKMKERDDDNTE